MNQRREQGYILLLVLMIISLSTFLVTYLTSKASVYIPYARMVIDREKAVFLALSGVNIGLSQLAFSPEKKSPEAEVPPQDKNKENSADKKTKPFLEFLLSVTNRWQVFELTKKRDGVEGKITVCIVGEEGKIDINAIYDFETKKFVGEGQAQGDYKKIMQEFFARIEKKVNGKDLFNGFEKFLKERQYRVQDVTELLTVKEFEVFKKRVWYEPSKSEKKEQAASEIFLTDLFTTHSNKPHIEPWLLSHSMIALLDLKQIEDVVQENKERVNEVLKKFKATSTWPTDWNSTLSLLYAKEFSLLPQGVEVIFNRTFAPKTFSVLSYATVGKVTQKVWAVIERKESSSPDDDQVVTTIKKLYWL